MLTPDEIKLLMKEFPEIGAGHWVFDPARNHSVERVRELMQLRRATFPKTIPSSKLKTPSCPN